MQNILRNSFLKPRIFRTIRGYEERGVTVETATSYYFKKV